MNTNTDTSAQTGQTSDTTTQTSSAATPASTGAQATSQTPDAGQQTQTEGASQPDPKGGDQKGGKAADTKGGDQKGTDQKGGDAPPWQDSLPKELAENPLFRNYKTVEEAMKAHAHLYKARGVPAERLVVLPDKPQDQAPEDWAAVHRALGVPDDPKDYKIELAAEAAADTPELESVLRELGQKARFQPAQMAAVIETLNSLGARAAELQAKAVEAEAKATTAELDREWGAAAEGNRRAIGKLLLDANGGKLDEAALADLTAKVGNSPAVARALAYAAKQMAEPGAPEGQGNGGQPGRQMTPAEATAGINAFYANPEKQKALMDRSHPQHDAAVKERAQLLAWQRGEKRPDQAA
jgi:hypothetical protein